MGDCAQKKRAATKMIRVKTIDRHRIKSMISPKKRGGAGGERVCAKKRKGVQQKNDRDKYDRSTSNLINHIAQERGGCARKRKGGRKNDLAKID